MATSKGLALVTGASAGIGREIAEILAREGYDLWLVARRLEALEELAGELSETRGVEARALALDLSDPHAPASLAAMLDEARRPLELLVNNAGFGHLGAFVQQDPASIAGMIRLNVESLTMLTRALLPPMVARGRGRIMQVASTAAFQPGPGMSVYYATKAYVLSFSEALHAELRDTGVTCTALCPGPTATEFQEVAGMEGIAKQGLRGMMMTSAREVAEEGVRATLAGRRRVVPGALNRVGAFSTRLAPRDLLLRVVREVNEGFAKPAGQTKGED